MALQWAAFLPLPAEAQKEGGRDPSALRAAWVAAYEAGDAAAMRDLYTADAVRMPYDAPAIEGRAKIMTDYEEQFARRTGTSVRIELTPLDVGREGEVIVVRGRYDEDWLGPDGAVRYTEVGKYVSILRRDGDGDWRYALSIFNRDATAGGNGGP